VARRFGTPVRTLMTLNGIGDDGAIRLGMRLILPEGVRDNGVDPYATGPSPFQDMALPEVSAPPPPPPPPSQTPPPFSTDTSAVGEDGFPTGAELARRAAGRFAWPVRGDLLTRYGTMGSGLRSDGINIGAAAGTEVRASAAGQVAYAGDSLPGLGTTVVIVHTDGWVTAYSHLGSTNVRMEQRVTQGQVIGTTGTTGGVTQPQVHFEIRYTPAPADRPRPVDPIPLLPR
jgi:murein DD-endopeptidase MepM/ murein hydrolase activator NlpD